MTNHEKDQYQDQTSSDTEDLIGSFGRDAGGEGACLLPVLPSIAPDPLALLEQLTAQNPPTPNPPSLPEKASNSKVLLGGPRIYVRFLTAEDASLVTTWTIKNREFLYPWEPRHVANYYTENMQRYILEEGERQRSEGRTYTFGIFLHLNNQPEAVAEEKFLGRIRLSNVMGGVRQDATLGYALAAEYNGQGYMTEAVGLIVRYSFGVLDLHRLQAATLLRNVASQKVLLRNGFRQEGLALRYIKINEIWEDHYLFGLTREEVTLS